MTNSFNQSSDANIFRLPFETKTLILTVETLNKYSAHRRTKKSPIKVAVRNISFSNAVLIFGVKLNEEREEQVYLQVTLQELLISCSVDTHKDYLSQYAYFALLYMMSVNRFFDFDKYYWPDFFDQETGKSKYFEVINDRCGMDILVKPEYDFFFKPNQKLYIPKVAAKIKRPTMSFSDGGFPNQLNDFVIGFCLVDTFLHSWHSNHLPFLIPYKGLVTRDKKKIKTFLAFISTNGDSSEYSPTQSNLCKLAIKMLYKAEIPLENDTEPQLKVDFLVNHHINSLKELFGFWQSAIPYLVNQPHTHHFHTHGFKNIRIIPKKSDMKPCKFSYEVPTICFLWRANEEFYELTYRFKIGDKLMIPNEKNTAFMISDVESPLTFYFFDSLSDCLITMFFAERKFKIFILKAHFEYFNPYWNWIRSNFDVEYFT